MEWKNLRPLPITDERNIRALSRLHTACDEATMEIRHNDRAIREITEMMKVLRVLMNV